MQTYRSDSAALMQASVCGAFAALADRVDGCCATLLDFSVHKLIEHTIADFLNESDGGAAVFVCGVRAILTLADVAPPRCGQLTDWLTG